MEQRSPKSNSLYPELVLICTNAKLIFTSRKKKIPSNGHEKNFLFNGYESFEKRFEEKTRRDRIKNEVFKDVNLKIC
jgi:hypothetical protein